MADRHKWPIDRKANAERARAKEIIMHRYLDSVAAWGEKERERRLLRPEEPAAPEPPLPLLWAPHSPHPSSDFVL